MATRPTLGLFIANIARPWELPQWRGVRDAARAQDVNLLCVLGGELGNPLGFAAQANVLYDLATVQQVAGLVLWTAGFDHYLDQKGVADFCARYSPLPIVSAEETVVGIPSVVMDTYQAMREAVVHLIETHGYRRIAFARHLGSDRAGLNERRRAYVETLADYGIPFDPDLLSPPYDCQVPTLEPELVDWLRAEKVAKWDALVAHNDMSLLKAMRALEAQNIRIPADVALVGFDDIPQAVAITPPLTTVHPPFYEMGQQAVQALLALIVGQPVPERIVVPSRLVVRQSCGCPDLAVSRAAALQPARPLTLDSFATAFHARRAQVLAEMLQAAEAGSDAELEERVTQLLEGFAAEITRAEITGPSGVFLKELDEALRRVTRLNGNLAAWHEVISALRRHVLPCLNTAEAAARAEDMWQQARVMLANMMERAQAHQQLQAEQVAGKLHEVSQELITTLDVEQLMQILAARLPELGIPSCYLALYESPQPYKYPQPAPEWSRLILACTEQGRLRLRPEDQRFPSRQLAPGALLSRDRSYALILKPLYFHDHQLGYILFEAGKCEEAVYDRLRRGISSALYAGLLTQQAWHHALQLQTAAEVSRAATSTLDLNQLLPQSVNLIRELFNAQYVGLFLLDAAGRFAVLRAGTGEAGQQMLEAGHKLEVGGPSMIGWCLAHGQARLARDVQQETVHAANPFLPATRSEIALPLITRGRAIGAMTIQAEQPAAFSEEDVAVLQTMAGQLANTIQNAQLHAAEKARAKELAQAYQALQENQRKLLVAEKMASVGRLTAGIAHEMNTPLAAARSALVELDNLIREYRDSMGDAEVTVADHQAIAGEMEKIAGVAANALERVMEFVQGVKSQTRDLAAPEHVTFDAVATIEETLLLLSYAALKRQCRVQFERAQPAIEMVGAPAKLSQLVTNLVMNAIEANTKQGGLVRLALRQEAETIVLQVSDQGQGIAPEHLTKIFDPMFTTKPFGEGAGLGLTIAHDIVVGNFGGTLQVASEVGRGTTFTALFPGRRPL